MIREVVKSQAGSRERGLARCLGSEQVNCLIEQIISIKKRLISGLEREFEGQNRQEQKADGETGRREVRAGTH